MQKLIVTFPYLISLLFYSVIVVIVVKLYNKYKVCISFHNFHQIGLILPEFIFSNYKLFGIAHMAFSKFCCLYHLTDFSYENTFMLSTIPLNMFHSLILYSVEKLQNNQNQSCKL
jgi:hypothetical protein